MFSFFLGVLILFTSVSHAYGDTIEFTLPSAIDHGWCGYTKVHIPNQELVFLSGGFACTSIDAYSPGGRKQHAVIVDIAAGTARMAANKPTATAFHRALYYDGKVYTIAGDTYHVNNPTDAVEIYDLATDTWSAGPSYPIALVGLECAIYQSVVVCAGGYTSGTFYANAYTIDLASTNPAWGSLPSLSDSRVNHGIAAADGYFYVIAGYCDHNCYASTIEVLDINNPTSWLSTSANTPDARLAPLCTSTSGKIYCIGGVVFSGTYRVEHSYLVTDAVNPLTSWTEDSTDLGTRGCVSGSNCDNIVSNSEDTAFYSAITGLTVTSFTTSSLVLRTIIASSECDASTAPANGGVGDCTSTLASGSACQPTCNTGYTVSGTSSCSSGTLSAATCQVAAPPPGEGDRSDDKAGGGTDMMLYIAGGLGITIPVIICMILGIWYKPALRKALLKCGCVWCANFLVPELETRMVDVEIFMAKQKLPRLRDFTPEIDASSISINRGQVLGTGGYGTVYKALYDGDVVAVKAMFEGDNNRLPTHTAKMMRNEAMIMCSLNHPNILRIFGVVSQNGWIVMDLCDGGALDDYLYDVDNIIDAREKARIAMETATGMAYLHMREVDIVHGDMKAGNVLLSNDKSVRICDFGMADAKNRSKTMTAAVAAAGRSVALTVPWSAPELFKGHLKTSKSDMYALGLTIWQIYERSQPFASMPEAAIVSQVLGGERPEFKDSPPSIKKIISVCWAKTPKDRPPAEKIACALNQMYESISRSKSSSGGNTVYPTPNFKEEIQTLNKRQLDTRNALESIQAASKDKITKMKKRESSKVEHSDQSDQM